MYTLVRVPVAAIRVLSVQAITLTGTFIHTNENISALIR
jgi:hypothetical protein